MHDAVRMSKRQRPIWRVWTDPGGLAWTDPGNDRSALRSAIEDCASTLSPVGQPPTLSTYWIDQLLAALAAPGEHELSHGNLWVLTLHGQAVEVRMDVDPETSEPLDVVGVDELMSGLEDLRREVLGQLAAGHRLDARRWPQQNPM